MKRGASPFVITMVGLAAVATAFGTLTMIAAAWPTHVLRRVY